MASTEPGSPSEFFTVPEKPQHQRITSGRFLSHHNVLIMVRKLGAKEMQVRAGGFWKKHTHTHKNYPVFTS